SGVSDREQVFDYARAADEAGVHSIWTAEAWGPDAVPMLTQVAERTKNIQVGTAILNIFSRTPALFAQTFGTLDVLSGGRMIIGLGTSGANVIEHFHGVPFKLPLTRMKEYVDIINTLISGEKLDYEGKIFKLHRGFTLRFDLPRKHIPIYIASLTPKSVEQTAQIADGWLPIWTPIQDVAGEVKRFRAAAAKAGRDPNSLTVRSPGSITITRKEDVERTRKGVAGSFAFYLARMGVFYYEHVSRLGYEEEAAAIKAAFDQNGSQAGAAAVPDELQQAVGFVTDSVDAARERLAEQEAAGIDLHSVEVRTGSPAETQHIYERLVS
ncbi:MAG TPA: LLM class flavin-dependent oxidoreductase, partial [Dehalococcoidia bacterium]|nr:LLM class flavin-dependent oxidoreductase [Dehalococcoidia bacterium]